MLQALDFVSCPHPSLPFPLPPSCCSPCPLPSPSDASSSPFPPPDAPDHPSDVTSRRAPPRHRSWTPPLPAPPGPAAPSPPCPGSRRGFQHRRLPRPSCRSLGSAPHVPTEGDRIPPVGTRLLVPQPQRGVTRTQIRGPDAHPRGHPGGMRAGIGTGHGVWWHQRGLLSPCCDRRRCRGPRPLLALMSGREDVLLVDV